MVVEPVGEADAAGGRVAGVGDEEVGGKAVDFVAAEDDVADEESEALPRRALRGRAGRERGGL